MVIIIFSLLSGILFGVGLTISRMIDPSKVIGFLDVVGSWDPSLALVMGGALLVTVPAFIIAKHNKMLFNVNLTLPSKTNINKPLIIGSMLFGLNWGLGEFYPGPGISALTFGLEKPLIFLFCYDTGHTWL